MKSLSSPPSAAADFLWEGILSPEAVTSEVRAAGFGAVVSFEGRIRDEEEGKTILSLTYEAYPAMAQKEIAKIIKETETRWPVKAAARHRVGRVPVGEAAVVVACAGAHREEAFAACRYLIDSVKDRAPIWKVRFECK